MNIPFLDLHRQYEFIKDEINESIQRVLQSQHFILGPEVEAFEFELAKYLEVKHVITVNSGTDALIFALRALGISKGDEVITVPNSFIATTLAITEVGATPIFVDCNPETYQIDETKIEEKITDKTKAILPVHLYGAPFQVNVIRKIADEHDLYLIEDAAQSIGATFNSQQLGTFGDLNIFSFYPGKNLGAYGDGGAISTNDAQLYSKLQKLRNYGQSQKYFHDQIGVNSRLDEIQAAVLRVKLKYIDKWNLQRREIAEKYNNLLNGIKTQKILIDGASNYHVFIIEHTKRDDLQKYLQTKGIQTLVHYPRPIHLQKCYENLGYQKGDFPFTENLSDVILSLPLYPELNTNEIEYISKTVLEFESQNT